MQSPEQDDLESVVEQIDSFLKFGEDEENEPARETPPKATTYDALQKQHVFLGESHAKLEALYTRLETISEPAPAEKARLDNCKRFMKKCIDAIPAYVFYDFECRQDEVVGENKLGKIFKHTPNLCIAYRVCTLCWDDKTQPCHLCGQREWVFQGDTCRDEFSKWLFSEERHAGRRAIAHNARGYDALLIKEYLFEQGIAPNVIENGTKILKLEYNGVTLIDSLSFLAMPLSKFPKTFGLKEMKKGYFPHLFNAKINEGYRGPIPAKKYFDPAGMKEDKARQEFDTWYAKQENKVYDLESEMAAYCHSDVDILTSGCMTFRRSFIEASGIDPYKNDITIASACSRVYRTRFMPQETIALIPPQGYSPKHNQSVKAMGWLKWLASSKGIDIRHALNGGEVRIGNYLVDGLHKNTVYEFYG